MSTPTDNLQPQFGDCSNHAATPQPINVPILIEKEVRIGPLVALKKPEPIPDAKGSLTADQLREIAKRHQPPASWFAGDEEQLF